MLPIPSIPNSKDLAGGIHIGDRYGIYEIEMCSHDRAISIKSPLGTVDISAFTGITIKAPNGDVNIQGKNVNIEAGNKVTITSGNNIKPEGIGTPDFRCGTPIWKKLKGWWGVPRFFANIGRGIRYGALFLGHQITAAAPTIVNNTLGPAAFADLSLIRHMFEVAVKPVDGTMLIKSKRYLKIEAGSGEAKIKADRFNGDKKIDSLEKFYIRLMATMIDFNDRITNFYPKYKTLWEDAAEEKDSFMDVECDLLKDPIVDDIGKEAFSMEEWDEFSFLDSLGGLYDDEQLEEGERECKGIPLTTNEEKDEVIVNSATAYAEAAFNLYHHAQSLTTLLDDYPDDDMFKKAAKEAFKKFAKEDLDKWTKKYGGLEPKPAFAKGQEEVFTKADTKTLLKRKTTALYLIKVAESAENKEGKFLTVGFDESDLTDRKVKSDYNWKNFMTHFDHAGTHGNKALIYLLDGLLEPIKKNFKNPVGVIKENDIWAAGKGGQILFSDNDGATLHIEGEGLKSESQSNLGNRDQLMKVLLSIK
jgi:hypothetical protein